MSEIVGLHVTRDGQHIVLSSVTRYYFVNDTDNHPIKGPSDRMCVHICNGDRVFLFQRTEYPEITEFMLAMSLYLETRT